MTKETTRPLGEWLRERREERGISLEQAEAETRIRARYLEALEAEEFDALPDPIVGRGFLRNYAAYLELDREEVVARSTHFGSPPSPEPLPGDGARPSGIEPFRPVPLHDMPGFRSSRGWLAGLAAIVIVAVALAAWWGVPRLVALWGDRSKPTPQSSATQPATSTALPSATLTPVLAAVETATETTLPTATNPTEPTLEPTLTATLTPSPSATPTRPVYLGVFLELVFTDTSWIQVSVDGVRQFQGELEDGTYRSWYGEERIELRIGSAGVVLVTVNGQSLGTLGAVGEVVDRVFEKVGEGVTEATITAEPSGTITVTVTATPGTATATPEATQPPPTEAPSATATAGPGATAAAGATEPATPEPETPTPTVETTSSATPTPTVAPTATAGP